MIEKYTRIQLEHDSNYRNIGDGNWIKAYYDNRKNELLRTEELEKIIMEFVNGEPIYPKGNTVLGLIKGADRTIVICDKNGWRK